MGGARVILVSAAWDHSSGRNAVRKRMATAAKRQRMRNMTLRRLRSMRKRKKR